MRESAWPSNCRKFKVGVSFTRGRTKKTWSNEIRDLEEWKVSKELPIDKNAFIFD